MQTWELGPAEVKDLIKLWNKQICKVRPKQLKQQCFKVTTAGALAQIEVQLDVNSVLYLTLASTNGWQPVHDNTPRIKRLFQLLAGGVAKTNDLISTCSYRSPTARSLDKVEDYILELNVLVTGPIRLNPIAKADQIVVLAQWCR